MNGKPKEGILKRHVEVDGFFGIGEGEPLTIISGPCVIEGEDSALRAAERLKKIMEGRPCNLIYKSSYDKANRSSVHSYRGPSLDGGLRILERVRREFNMPIVTDVHSPEEAEIVGAVCDMVQVPAFLCRQTDLVCAAAKTGKVVSVKKGQFLSPWDMKNVIEKIVESGNRRILTIDRGTSFGYNNLVSDFRAIPVMAGFGFPTCFDATHSVQLPGSLGAETGGQREFILNLAKAAVVVGVDALFFEAHESPDHAKCDASSMLSFDQLPDFLDALQRIFEVR